MPVDVQSNLPDDDSDRNEEELFPQEGDGSGVEESTEIELQPGEISTPTQSNQESSADLDGEDSSIENDFDLITDKNAGLPEDEPEISGEEVEGSFGIDPAVEPIGSHEFYSTYTARGWYNPDEKTPANSPDPPPTLALEDEPITGDTQPVIISSHPQPLPSPAYPVPPDISSPNDGIQPRSPSQIDVNATQVASTAYAASKITTINQGKVTGQSKTGQSRPQVSAADPPTRRLL